jgi:hypothetical protein
MYELLNMGSSTCEPEQGMRAILCGEALDWGDCCARH